MLSSSLYWAARVNLLHCVFVDDSDRRPRFKSRHVHQTPPILWLSMQPNTNHPCNDFWNHLLSHLDQLMHQSSSKTSWSQLYTKKASCLDNKHVVLTAPINRSPKEEIAVDHDRRRLVSFPNGSNRTSFQTRYLSSPALQPCSFLGQIRISYLLYAYEITEKNATFSKLQSGFYPSHSTRFNTWYFYSIRVQIQRLDPI